MERVGWVHAAVNFRGVEFHRLSFHLSKSGSPLFWWFATRLWRQALPSKRSP